MTTQQDNSAPPRISPTVQVGQRWEYYQEDNCSTQRLNALGQVGWRLVGPPAVKAFAGHSNRLVYVFERPSKG